jgi:VanZ family protein
VTAVLGWWGPVIVYAAAIFAASSMSQPPTPGAVPDYTLHGSGFAGFALVIIRALARGRWDGVTGRRVILTVAIAAAYGLTDEFHQRFVPGRFFELRDLVADAVGAGFAAAAIYVGSLARSRAGGARRRSSHDDIPSADFT